MKDKMETWKITLAGMLIGMGLLIPYVTSHAFGLKGTVFLPMHYTVFLAGFLCGPVCGAVAGMMTPLLSSILTGMPALFPMLPVMMCELFVYGWMTGVIYQKGKSGVYRTLICSMLAGRLVHGIVFALLLIAKNTPVTLASAGMFVVEGIPGTIMQLIVIPPIVKVLGKEIGERIGRNGQSAVKWKEIVKEELLEHAKQMIRSEECSFVVIKEGRIVYQDKGNGVKPILKLIDTDRELLKNAVVVDKIIGKAAALLLVLGEVKMVYGITMSQAGKDYLVHAGINVNHEKCIDVISNRKRDGICPLERAVSDIEDPKQAHEKLKETIAQLMKSAV